MAFADNLKSLRISKGINQNELARAVCTTAKSISHWETGYSEPSISQLISLADYFEISVDDLIEHTSL